MNIYESTCPEYQIDDKGSIYFRLGSKHGHIDCGYWIIYEYGVNSPNGNSGVFNEGVYDNWIKNRLTNYNYTRDEENVMLRKLVSALAAVQVSEDFLQ